MKQLPDPTQVTRADFTKWFEAVVNPIPPDPADLRETREEADERARCARESRVRRWESRVPSRFKDVTVADLTTEQGGDKVAAWWTSKATTLILRSVVPGVGKCLTGDAVIYDPETGLPWRLGDVVRDMTVTSVPTVKGAVIRVAPIQERIDSGVQATVTVRTASGREVTCTRHHPLLTAAGWARADEIRVGETIASVRRMPFPQKSEAYSDAEIDLLALLVAEGSGTAGHGGIRFSTGDPVMLDRAYDATLALGMGITSLGKPYDYLLTGCLPIPPQPAGGCACGCGAQTVRASRSDARAGHVKGELQKYRRGHTSRRSAPRAFARTHGLTVLAKVKTMPEAAYRMDEKSLRRFLSVLWMADGYIDVRAPGMTLASKPLLVGVQHLLLRLGIVSSVKFKNASIGDKSYPAWRLSVPAAGWRPFAEALTLWGEKARRADVLAQRGPNVRKRIGVPKGTRPVDLSLATSPDLWWDVVTAVTDAGERQVYDLSVPETECFVANDIVVHNTHAAYAVGNQAVASGAWAAAWSMPDLNMALRPGQDPSAVDVACECDLLVVDDVGRERINEWTLEQFHAVIDARWRNRLRTVVTTNLPGPVFHGRYGDPVVDRLIDGAWVVLVLGESRRANAPW